MIWESIKQKLDEGQYSPEDGVMYWRERVLKSIFLIVIIFGFLPYLFGSYIAIKMGVYSVMVTSSIAYFTVVFLFFTKWISLFIRIFLIILLTYAIGFMLVFNIGPESSGLSYFIGGSLLAALLLGIRGSIWSLIINIVLFIFIAIGLYYDLFKGLMISKYTIPLWVTVTLSTEIICLMSSIPLAMLLNGLEKTITKQKTLQKTLQEKVSLLDLAKSKAEEADKLKTTFLANMSHEIRTPLNAILGFTELLQLETYESTEEKNNYLSTIHNSGTYLLNIIKNILDFSIIESGQMKFNIKEFSIKDIMTDLEQMYKLSAKENNDVSIIFDIPENEKEILINSDIDKIKQVMINLINNALNNMENGTIHVGYREKDTKIEFFVSDNGSGIPADIQTSIFKRFVKIEGKNRIMKGTGLGLPISKGIVNALGGEIWIRSKPSEGSTFYFTIPQVN